MCGPQQAVKPPTRTSPTTDPPAAAATEPPVLTTTAPGSFGRPLAELGQPPLEEAPLGRVVDQGQGPVERLAGLLGAPETAQQLAAGRVQVVAVLQVEAVGGLQARLGALGLGDRDRPGGLPLPARGPRRAAAPSRAHRGG